MTNYKGTIMKPEYEYGDVLIKRIANGWLVVQGSEHDEDRTQIFVYEDKENPTYIAESLYNLLCEQFECYMQSKRTPGIKMSFSHQSIEEEEAEEDES
tara:strand:- start:131 stop:424 length:294 start_codon:yes stop_codon:yes gene_type:complete